MSYTSEEGRLQILEDTAGAVAQLALAIEQLGEAYDHLEEHAAERMEDSVFRPLQAAYGQLRRARTEFAARHNLTASEPPPGTTPAPHDARTALESAADSIEAADEIVSELQDSLLPVEVGDRELRTALSQVRTVLGPLPGACDQLIRTFGR